MAVHRIPVDKLSPEALQGVIEEFISRDGTDYGEIEASSDTKFRQVKSKLEKGEAVLVFDDEVETTNIFLAMTLISEGHGTLIDLIAAVTLNLYFFVIHQISLSCNSYWCCSSLFLS